MAFTEKQWAFAIALLLSCALGEGCAPKSPSAKLCFVRMQALLPYSPPLFATASSASPPSAIAAPAATPVAFPTPPPPFVFPPPIGATLAAARRQQLSADAARYLQRFTESLQDAAQLDFNRYKKEQQTAAQQQLQQAADTIRAQSMSALQSQLAQLNRQEMLLQFREIAVQTQVRATAGIFANSQAHLDALSQQRLIAQQIAQVEAGRKQLVEQADQQIAQAISQTRQQIEADLQNHLQAYRKQQAAEIARRAMQAAENQQALLQEVNLVLPPIPSTPPPGVSLPVTLSPPSRVALPTAQQAVQRATLNASIQAAQIGAELAKIRLQALRQEVLAILQQQGWHLVPQGTPGAFDATDFVKTQLQQERERSLP
ncbi:hypothetical protein CTKA_01862 [Chthonomonas calidirosea]|uniref:Uncharacterized protein n=1 Tax=Chthonomonas calidirosea (strain DSM 23976 / ICMP 18418 / T49) TaxID=1303518 RepID=S0EZT0_CHTCT|nr:hypothetical protein [Chthonomonas calidirosea]CCW36040.1 hypothetical protein CCALI_02233 [Chthonomonas calidirosea T49]CEK18511.1 hypothetical protein CTKA_01862 [Chthonomonas calidirosea]